MERTECIGPKNPNTFPPRLAVVALSAVCGVVTSWYFGLIEITRKLLLKIKMN